MVIEQVLKFSKLKNFKRKKFQIILMIIRIVGKSGCGRFRGVVTLYSYMYMYLRN